MARYRAGAVVARWRLLVPLGHGSNAQVWRAGNEADGEVALKILHTRDPSSEPYLRFRDEVDLVRTLRRPGVVPLLDADVPASPSRERPAWLAMPVAQPLVARLGTAPPLEQVVETTGDIAEILAQLAEEGIHHRDVKPGNLYWHEERPAVGDFGLATFPDKRELTRPGTRLGPLYYHAPEMLLDPVGAASGAADVYSLAKTLWVLGSGHVFPLPGELRADKAVTRISSYHPHPRATSLEVLLEAATAAEPAERPTMAELATELRTWLRSPAKGAEGAVRTGTVSTLAEGARRWRIDARRRQTLTDRQRETLQALRRELAGLQRELTGIGVRCEIDSRYTMMHELLELGEHSRDSHGTLRGGCYVKVSGPHDLLPWSPGDPIAPTLAELCSGFWVNGLETGEVEIVAAHVVIEFAGIRNSDRRNVVWHEEATVHAGSPSEAHEVARLTTALRHTLDEALTTFTAALERRS